MFRDDVWRITPHLCMYVSKQILHTPYIYLCVHICMPVCKLGVYSIHVCVCPCKWMCFTVPDLQHGSFNQGFRSVLSVEITSKKISWGNNLPFLCRMHHTLAFLVMITWMCPSRCHVLKSWYVENNWRRGLGKVIEISWNGSGSFRWHSWLC